MKRFKNILSEVAEPKPAEEKKFKDQHQVEIIDPLGLGDQEGYKPKSMPKKRLGDYMKGQDTTAYDQAYSKKNETSPKMEEVETNEEVEQIEEETSVPEKRSFKSFLEEAPLVEDPSEEIPMMVGQLRFIEYAAREIEDYLTDTAMDPEEWFQNKLASAHAELKTLHAYAEGKRYEPHDDHDDDDIANLAAGYPMYSSYYESLEEGTVDHAHYTFTVGPKKKGGAEGAPSHVAAKVNKMKKAGVPHHDEPGEYGNTVHVHVKNNKTGATSNHHVYQRDTDKGSKEALVSTRTVGANKSSTAASHEKALHHFLSGKRPASLKEESQVEMVEGVKAGTMRLKDGKSVKVSPQDAKMLNDVMKSLNPKNRKEMEANMMKDTQGFKDIMAFAKEAE